MAREENSCICLHMQLIAILSRIGVKKGGAVEIPRNFLGIIKGVNRITCWFTPLLAEREGFEPSVRLPVQRFSRPSRSTTPASFLKPSAKLRLFSEKHHFYPIFFNQKVGQAEKRMHFTLSTNHQQIVIRQPLFPSPTFQVARFRINTSRTFGG